MARSTSAILTELSQLAATQGGFLTAAQATAAGITWQALNRLAKRGFLEREERGLYRLSHLPIGENAELWKALLWPALDRSDGVRAVLCYGTALSLYDVSTINPKKTDVAVPRAVRVRRRHQGLSSIGRAIRPKTLRRSRACRRRRCFAHSQT